MKKFQCDICKKEVGEYDLNTLVDMLKTEDTQHACDTCNKELKDVLRRIDDVLRTAKYTWLQKVMLKMREKWSRL